MDEGVDRRLTARLDELHWAVSSSRKGGCHILAHHHTRKLHVCSFTPRRRYLQPHHSCLPWSREKERRMTKRELKLYKKLFSLQRHTKMDFVSALVAMPVDYGNMFSKRCRQKTPPISQAHQKNRGSCDFFDRIEGAKVRFPSAESGGCKKRRFRRHSQLRRGHLLLHAAQVGTKLIHGCSMSVCLSVSHTSLQRPEDLITAASSPLLDEEVTTILLTLMPPPLG